MRIGAYAVALLNLLLLSFFVCQSLHLPFCNPRLFRFGSLFHEAQPALTSTTVTAITRPGARPAEAHFRVGALEEKSFFLPWIQKDFQLWTSNGISLVSCMHPVASDLHCWFACNLLRSNLIRSVCKILFAFMQPISQCIP